MSVFPGDDYVSIMRRRDYESVIASRLSYREALLASPNPYEFRNLSVALLRAGQVTQAIEHFEQLIDVISPDMQNSVDFCELGAAHWLLGNVEKSVCLWKEALQCNYGDGAKNMTPALLLYYAGIRLSDGAVKQESASLIAQKLNTGWAKNWPAPLGRFLLNDSDEGVVTKELLKQHPLRQPDEFCRLDFYRGAKNVESDCEAVAKTCFRSAVDRLEQKTSTTEFVLARHELEETQAVC